jgi:hypothetical protein
VAQLQEQSFWFLRVAQRAGEKSKVTNFDPKITFSHTKALILGLISYIYHLLSIHMIKRTYYNLKTLKTVRF